MGEWSTACFGTGRGNKIELADEIRFPHSLGLLYSAMTYYTGFRVNSGEYKLMGLAPYGEPRFRTQILDHLIDLKDDGSFHMDMSYFNYCEGLTMTSKKFHDLFGGPPRAPESNITQHEMDLAASVQSVTEEVMLRMSHHIHAETGCRNLVLAGGVALNCVGNGRLLREGPFDDIWIQPAAGDAGGALGNALFIWHQLLDQPRVPEPQDTQHGSFLGPEYTDEQVTESLQQEKAVHQHLESDQQLCDTVAALIADQKVVGWFQGRMEFGPRALGGRSILGDARSVEMQSVMNQKIKFRESFRPFAPMVLDSHKTEYFELDESHQSPYMLMVTPVQQQIRAQQSPAEQQAFGIDKLNHARSTIPAVTHVDYSARIQTIDETRNPLMHQLLTAFHQLTGCPVVINTSFNVRSEPIVCTPQQAFQCFMTTEMDALVIGRFLLLKTEQIQTTTAKERQHHLTQFPLD